MNGKQILYGILAVFLMAMLCIAPVIAGNETLDVEETAEAVDSGDTVVLDDLSPATSSQEPISQSDIPIVFVYQQTSYTGEWIFGENTVTFEDGVVEGDSIVEGIYTNDTGYQIELVYPRATVDITLDGESIIGKTIHPADAPFLNFSVTSDNGYYTEGGEGLGLVFTNEEQGISDAYIFGGKYLSDSNWGRESSSQYSSSSFAKTGVWTVRAAFTTSSWDTGELIYSTPDAYRYGQSYTFTVSEDVDAAYFPCILLSGDTEYSLDSWYSHRINVNYYDASGQLGSDSKVLLTSSNPSVLQIDADGYMTDREAGTVTITAVLSDDPSVSSEIEVTVENTIITKIQGKGPAEITMGTEAFADIYAANIYGLYDQFEEPVYRMIQWEILEGDSNITLTEEGTYHADVTITPISPGTATIVAYPLSDPEIQWVHTLTVLPSPIIDPDVTPTPDDDNDDTVALPATLSLSCYDTTLYLGASPSTGSATAYVLDSLNNRMYNEEINWKVENESVLSLTVDTNVNENTHSATLTPKAIGTTTIYAYAKNNASINASKTITVLESVITSVDFSRSVPTTMSMNTSENNYVGSYDQYGRVVYDDTLNITITPANILQISGNGYSSNSSLVVDSDDYVTLTPVAPGTVTIRAESIGNSSAYTERTVEVIPAEISSIDIRDSEEWYGSSITTRSVKEGSSFLAYIHAFDSQNSRLSVEGLPAESFIVWTVENPEILAFAVNETKIGEPVEMMGVSEGKTTVRASLKSNLSIYDEITVSVIPASVGSYVLIQNMPKNITLQSVVSTSPRAYLDDQYGSSLSNVDIVWTVGNSDILEITPNTTKPGNSISLIPKAVGTTTIRAAAKNDQTRYDEVTITVSEPEISVYLSGTTAMSLDSNVRGSATAYFKDQFGFRVPGSILWSVDKPDILTILSMDEDEVTLKPLNLGTVTLTASSASNANLTESISISIQQPVVRSIEVYDTFPTAQDREANLLFLGTTESVYVSTYGIRDSFGSSLSDVKLLWSVDNTSVLNLSTTVSSVNEHVTVTPIQSGTATITVSCGNVQDSVTVTVEEPVGTSLSVSQTSLKITTGNTETLRATVYNQGWYEWFFGETVYWSVDNETVIELSATSTKTDSWGDTSITVTPKNVGTTNITVYPASNHDLGRVIPVVVEDAVVDLIHLSSMDTLLLVGTNDTINACVDDQFGYKMIDESVQWSVNNSAVIDLSSTDSLSKKSITIIPKTAGVVALTATSISNPQANKTIVLTVEEPVVTEISTSPSTLQMILDESAEEINVWAYNQEGSRMYGESFIWSVDNDSVVEISSTSTNSDNSGWSSLTVTPKAIGTTNITVYAQSNPSVTKNIPVIVASQVLSSLYVSPSSVRISLGSTESITAYVENQFNENVYGEAILWSVDNESVITLSETSSTSGKSVKVTPQNVGTTTITIASATDASLVKKIPVTVEPTIIQSVSLDIESSSPYFIGETYSGTANVRDQFSDLLPSEKVIWSVDKPDVLELSITESQSGKKVTLTPKSKGEVTITVKSASDPSKTVSETITVDNLIISSIGVGGLFGSVQNISLDSVSDIYVSSYDQTGRTIKNPALAWTVQNSSVLDIYSSSWSLFTGGTTYVIEPKEIGSTTITVYSLDNPEISASFPVTVTPSVPSTLQVGLTESVSIDAYTYLTAIVRDQYNNFLSDGSVTVTVENESVAKLITNPQYDSVWSEVPFAYMINPIAEGQTKITVEVKGNTTLTEEVMLNVVDDSRANLVIRGAYTNMATSSEMVALVTAVDQFKQPIKPEHLQVLSSNTEVLDISFVSEKNVLTTLNNLLTSNGLSYTAKITSYAAGDAEISVKMKDDSVVSDPVLIHVADDQEVTQLFCYYIDETQYFGSPYIVEFPYPNTGSLVLELGESSEAGIGAMTQQGYLTTNAEVDIYVDDPSIALVERVEPVNGYAGLKEVYGLTITGLKEGVTTLHAVSKADPSITSSMKIYVYNATNAPIIPDEQKPVTTVLPPEFSPGATTFAKSQTVSISTGTEGAAIHYTTDGSDPTEDSPTLTGSLTISKTTMVKAIAVKDGVSSAVTSALYTLANPSEKHGIIIVSVDGGTVTADKTSAAEDELISLAFSPEDDTWKLTGWTITGTTSGKVVEKTAAASKFAMWGEPVTVKAEFTKIVDPTPKPFVVKITNLPDRLYEDDTGTLNAVIYDQFGERLEYNTVTWKSDNSSIISIDETSGAYTAESGGVAKVTATALRDTTISASVEIPIYVPPTPFISGDATGPTTAYYGVMSDPFLVTSTYASHLNWDWGDGSETSAMNREFAWLMARGIDADWAYTSTDSVAHTFIELGDLTVTLTPSNTYRFGDAKTFTIHVEYAPPRNLKITDGKSSVIAGETATYSAFATGADTFTWYLDGVEIAGQTGAVASITFPETTTAKQSTIIVVASKEGKECEPVTKTVDVSVPGGALGAFSSLTVNPTEPTKNEVAVFSIDKVTNAVEYIWTFDDGETIKTSSPSVSYALKDTTTSKVTVTAKNSVGTESKKEYTFTPAGEKPSVPSLTADKTTAYSGDTIVFTASADHATSYKWTIDGVTDTSVTSSTYSKMWTVDDVGKHQITVSAVNKHGTNTKSIGYTVLPKPGKPATIDKILGPSTMVEGTTGTLSAVITSNDAYTIAWYQNGELLSDTSATIKLTPTAGTYTMKIVVTTTEYEEVSEFEKTVIVKAKEGQTPVKDDTAKADAENEQNLRMVESSTAGQTALGSVNSIAVDTSDISSEAADVHVKVSTINTEDLHGFTAEMGDEDDVLMSVEILPEGLSNEKDLSRSASITFSLPKNEVADPATIQFYRLDTGSGIDQWVKLTIERYVLDGDSYIFTVKTSGMSKFVASSVAQSGTSSTPTTPATPVKDTREQISAVTPAEVKYSITTEQLPTITAPTVTNGKSSLLMKNITIVKKVGSTETEVPSVVGTNGKITISGTVSDADSLTVTFQGRPLGDVTGDQKADTLDAARLLQASAKLYDLDEEAVFYGDVSADGETNTFDAARILQYSAKLTDDNYNLKS